MGVTQKTDTKSKGQNDDNDSHSHKKNHNRNGKKFYPPQSSNVARAGAKLL